jgi:hypothetical protein
MLFEEVTAVYSENNAKPVNALCWENALLLIAKEGGTYNYQWLYRADATQAALWRNHEITRFESIPSIQT